MAAKSFFNVSAPTLLPLTTNFARLNKVVATLFKPFCLLGNNQKDSLDNRVSQNLSSVLQILFCFKL